VPRSISPPAQRFAESPVAPFRVDARCLSCNVPEVAGRFRYQTYAADTLAKSIKRATKPVKQAVIAPSMLALLYPLHEEVPGYPRTQFEDDLCNECEKDIRGP